MIPSPKQVVDGFLEDAPNDKPPIAVTMTDEEIVTYLRCSYTGRRFTYVADMEGRSEKKVWSPEELRKTTLAVLKKLRGNFASIQSSEHMHGLDIDHVIQDIIQMKKNPATCNSIYIM